jgi:hypothetical protein
VSRVDLERLDALLVDIDGRLSELLLEALRVEVWDYETAVRFCQAAYGKGREDALADADPASLHRRHGYRVPERASVET